MDYIVLNPFAKLISTEYLTPDQRPVAIHFWDFDSQSSKAEQDCFDQSSNHHAWGIQR